MVDRTTLRDLNYQKEKLKLNIEYGIKLIKICQNYGITKHLQPDSDFIKDKQKELKRINEQIKEYEREKDLKELC